MFTTACLAESKASAVVSREPTERAGLLCCAVLLAFGDAWGVAGREGTPDAGLVVKVHAGGADEMRCCPAGTKDGAVTRSRCGKLHCKAAHGPSEVANAAGSACNS